MNTTPFFTGTRALVHGPQVWTATMIPMAVWQPVIIAFLYLCISFPPLFSKEREKKTPDRKLALWVQVMVIYAVQILYFPSICHDTGIVTRKHVMRSFKL